jgi:hypothetical protein
VQESSSNMRLPSTGMATLEQCCLKPPQGIVDSGSRVHGPKDGVNFDF